MSFKAQVRTLSTSARSRMGVLVALASLSLSLGSGCAAEGEDQEGPQFPQGQRPIGTAGVPSEDATEAQAVGSPAEGGQAWAPHEPTRAQTIVIGNDGAVPSDGPSEMQSDEYADADPSALTDFHTALDPYGQWGEDPTYGTIWQPSAAAVGSDFAPYETAGHWSYGDDYTWVSDYSWGWAPFHYGRWVYATNGWGWIPGRQYAGAWTSWRTGVGGYGGYVGWAPLPPTWYWRGGTAVGIGIVPPAAYAFCRTGDLFSSSLGSRMITGPQVGAIGSHTQAVAGNPGTPAGRGVMGGYGGGRTLANPAVAGPSPQSMHIAQRDVTRPPTNNAGLNHAAQFSHPSTAVALGAHGPAGWNGAAVSRNGAVPSRPYGSSMGTSAYGRYSEGVHQTRTLAGGDHTYVGGHAVSAFHGGTTFSRGAGGAGPGAFYHGGGVHGGVAPAPQNHPQYYGGGYHPSASGGGGGGGGHFGGHGGGGGGHSGGHR